MKDKPTEVMCSGAFHNTFSSLVENKVVWKTVEREENKGGLVVPTKVDKEFVQHTCLGCGERWFDAVKE